MSTTTTKTEKLTKKKVTLFQNLNDETFSENKVKVLKNEPLFSHLEKQLLAVTFCVNWKQEL
jgi:hypothetical protein